MAEVALFKGKMLPYYGRTLFVVIGLWSFLALWSASGQQLPVPGHQQDQDRGSTLMVDTPYLDMTTADTSSLDNITENTLEAAERPILGVGQYSHSDQVFLWTTHSQTYSSTDKALMGHVFLVLTAKKSAYQCALECLKRSRCSSFNMLTASHLCELSDSDHLNSPTSYADLEGSEYHVKSTFSIDEFGKVPKSEDHVNQRRFW
ncbi:hypothetical protein RRG08_029928 [Elysia crispata]|uniref:Apple domain-containing protein n=1 Tax=Elysia crispata TaxID=231223 RepID=A0AAE0ZIV6_9GAST|nr:hypothetical protein RRG08_029928 [Elysia crispata]